MLTMTTTMIILFTTMLPPCHASHPCYHYRHQHNFIIDNDKPPLRAIRLNADGTIDPAELQRFGVEPLPVGVEAGQGPEGNLGFIANEGVPALFGYDALQYDGGEGPSARRQAIVNELAARNIQRPNGPW
jgi:hypothetical protein